MFSQKFYAFLSEILIIKMEARWYNESGHVSRVQTPQKICIKMFRALFQPPVPKLSSLRKRRENMLVKTGNWVESNSSIISWHAINSCSLCFAKSRSCSLISLSSLRLFSISSFLLLSLFLLLALSRLCFLCFALFLASHFSLALFSLSSILFFSIFLLFLSIFLCSSSFFFLFLSNVSSCILFLLNETVVLNCHANSIQSKWLTWMP